MLEYKFKETVCYTIKYTTYIAFHFNWFHETARINKRYLVLKFKLWNLFWEESDIQKLHLRNLRCQFNLGEASCYATEV